MLPIPRPAPQTTAANLPVAVRIAVPPGGFGAQLAVMRAWLDAACGPGCWSAAPASSNGVRDDQLAFFFADRGQADAFVERFCCGFRTLLTG